MRCLTYTILIWLSPDIFAYILLFFLYSFQTCRLSAGGRRWLSGSEVCWGVVDSVVVEKGSRISSRIHHRVLGTEWQSAAPPRRTRQTDHSLGLWMEGQCWRWSVEPLEGVDCHGQWNFPSPKKPTLGMPASSFMSFCVCVCRLTWKTASSQPTTSSLHCPLKVSRSSACELKLLCGIKGKQTPRQIFHMT